MRALWLSSGPVLWALHFAAIYGFTALACARGFGHAAPGFVGAVTVPVAALAAAVVFLKARGDFVDWLAAALAGAALLAVLAQAIPAFMVPPCA